MDLVIAMQRRRDERNIVEKATPGNKPSVRAGIEDVYEVVHDSIGGMMRLV